MKPNWQKLKDKELDWHIFEFRSKLLDLTRQFFKKRGFLEIESPLMTRFPTLDSNIHSVEVLLEDDNGTPSSMYLHTSPEHAMKKLIAGRAKKIFYLGKVFRNREQTNLHNPEFTLCEWYQTEADYTDIMKETEALIHFLGKKLLNRSKIKYQGQKIDIGVPFDKRTVQSLFIEHTGIDLELASDLFKFKKLADLNGHIYNDTDTWDDLYFRLFLNHIEKDIGKQKATFVTEYPSRMALMAKVTKDNPLWVERAELYIGGLELANGYTELTDPQEQRERFLEELKKKQMEGFNYSIDEELIDALKSGLPPCSGMALGIDRLIMLFLDKTNIEDVLLFPVSQW